MTNDARVRVLVVDDSAFARKVMREVLQASPKIEVVGIARDGLDALERIAELKPDVVTLDLVMPNLDGLGVLRALPADGAPRVVVVSTSDSDSELGLAALEAGAVDVVHKPTALATDRLYDLGAEVVAKVLNAARSRAPRRGPNVAGARTPFASTDRATHAAKLVVIGASTGGPQALTRLVNALPEGFPAPVAIVLHIPAGYTTAFAARVDGGSAVEVIEAYEGVHIGPGRVVVARAGQHLRLERGAGGAIAHLGLEPVDSPHRPSVDVLFKSAALGWGADVIAVVLTGMGDDGLAGSRAVREAGGYVLTEAESSCVVYGMPQRVFEAGLSNAVVPLEDMASALVRLV